MPEVFSAVKARGVGLELELKPPDLHQSKRHKRDLMRPILIFKTPVFHLTYLTDLWAINNPSRGGFRYAVAKKQRRNLCLRFRDFVRHLFAPMEPGLAFSHVILPTKVCTLDNRTPLSILNETSSHQDCTAYEHRDTGEDRKRKIPVLLSKRTTYRDVGHSTAVMVSEIKGVE
jgi:hypothetical protein